MLSFDEWRKRIAEKEMISDSLKTKPVSQSSQQQSVQSSPPNGQSSQTNKKLTKRARNFASYECGAKVVDTNPEAESAQRILNEQTDEYLLNPCKAKIWFVIELCETIQPKNIEIANFELYSSVPKEFNIQASDHYPTRDWSSLGSFTTADERSVQRFQLQNNGFVKFIKIEMMSHYGTEHFCPLSVVRIFGTSLFEEVERIDNIGNHPTEDDSDSTLYEELVGEDSSSQNLFGTARDAVINIVRKAAQALNGNANPEADNDKNGNISDLNTARLELISNHLFPKISHHLIDCNHSSHNLSQSLKPSQKCLYLELLLGDDLFNQLNKQYLTFNLINNNSQEVSELSKCKNSIQNITKNLTKIESVIDSQSNGFVPPTDPIPDNSELLSVINVNIDKSLTIESSDSVSIDMVKDLQNNSESIEATIISSTSTPELSSTESIDVLKIPVYKDSNNTLIDSNNWTKTEDIVKNMTQTEGQAFQSSHHLNGNGHIASNSVVQSKESVVLRLSNRIKSLEVNLSLTSLYLEELSQRYRKQMEEMQRAFNVTISKLNDTATQAAVRDLKQQESIAQMESKISALSDRMVVLMSERESLNWHYIEVHIGLMMIEMVVVIAIIFICVYRLSKRIKSLQTIETNGQMKVEANIIPPFKRSNPSKTHCPLPAKTLRIEDDIKAIDSQQSVNAVNVQRKLKKKKKKNSNILVPYIGSQNKSNDKIDKNNENKNLLTTKSQSTPVLTNDMFNSQLNTVKNSTSDETKSRNNSCHSSSSGVSSIVAINQNVFNKSSKILNEINSNRLETKYILNNKKQTERSSLSSSLKKLLKIERK